MKQILFLFACFLAFTATKAQQTMLSATGYTADTVTNAGVKTLTPASSVTGSRKVATASLTITKISGTGAGTAQLQGSLDGVNWYNVGSAYTITDVTSQTTFIKQTDLGDLWTRWLVTGTGTESIKIAGKFYTKP